MNTGIVGFFLKINIVPLVDVILVLLVIFMVTTPMLHRGIDITLPRSQSNTVVPMERLVITIEPDKRVYLGKDLVTLIHLRKRLDEAKALNPLVSVYLRADRHVPYGRIVQVMDEVKGVGIERLGMVTNPQGRVVGRRGLRASVSWNDAMSYATAFSLLSFHLPDHDDSVAERLSWPLAGSVLIHTVVFIALLSLRFASSLEQSDGSYEVTLVTLPEIAASPTALPAKESRLKKKVDKVLPPKAKARQAGKAAPQSEAVMPPSKAVRTTSSRSPVKPRVPKQAMDSLVSQPKTQVPVILPNVVTPPVAPDPRPTLKQNTDMLPPLPRADVREVRKPERVTESLVSALDSVVVPKPQTQALPRQSAPGQACAPCSRETGPCRGDGRAGIHKRLRNLRN